MGLMNNVVFVFSRQYAAFVEKCAIMFAVVSSQVSSDLELLFVLRTVKDRTVWLTLRGIVLQNK